MSESNIVYVIRHLPGPVWQDGVEYREQPGVGEHVAYYRQWHEAGKLLLGGPFLADGAGGMMVTVAGLDASEVEAFAAADPTIKSGLLTYEMFPWMLAMRGDGA